MISLPLYVCPLSMLNIPYPLHTIFSIGHRSIQYPTQGTVILSPSPYQSYTHLKPPPQPFYPIPMLSRVIKHHIPYAYELGRPPFIPPG